MKQAIFATVLVTVILAICYFQATAKLKLSIERADNLQAEVTKLRSELKTYKDLPDWYIQAYTRCNTEQVPKSFMKDCICFEVQGY